MYKIIKADKDAYITNKIVKDVSKVSASTGGAGTLDLFKLYHVNGSNVELSRAVVHFDLTDLKTLFDGGRINTNSSNFWCKLRLRDVYGGQATPRNFTLSVFPLAKDFDEGIGKDISYYSDIDACNWLSSSVDSLWYEAGCARTSDGAAVGDYLTSSISIVDTEVTQAFSKGDEDLLVDVTSILSATLNDEISDYGFRISFLKTLEDNSKTYFVKRFASNNAYNESKRPALLVGFDDSVSDDSQNLTLDTYCRLNLYNYDSSGQLATINTNVSGTLIPVIGDNCITLKLSLIPGQYLTFSGSQLSFGSGSYTTGIYTSLVSLPTSNATVAQMLSVSGSVSVTPIWCSNDLTSTFLSGSSVTFTESTKLTTRGIRKFVVSITNMRDVYFSNELALLRFNIFDQSSPIMKVTKLPLVTPGLVLKNVYYQIRDVTTNEVVVPFDDQKNSTKISNDSEGMYFYLDGSNLLVGRAYCIDIMIFYNGIREKFMNVSPMFRIEKGEGAMQYDVLGISNVGNLGYGPIYDQATGTLYITNLVATNITGSLTTLIDGSPYINGGANITVTTGSNGSVTISAENLLGYVTASFSNATTVTVNHGLNTALYDIEVFDASNSKILPKGATATSSTQAVVTFGGPTSGYVLILGKQGS